MLKKYRRSILLSLLMGGYTAFCVEVGARIGAEGSARLSDGVIYVRLAATGLLYSVLVFVSWEVVPEIWRRRSARRRNPEAVGRTAGGRGENMGWLDRLKGFRLPFWLSMLLLLAMWTPVYLSIFPGAFAYDAPTQWQQFRDWAITSHHPVLHTLLIGICLSGGGKTSLL